MEVLQLILNAIFIFSLIYILGYVALFPFSLPHNSIQRIFYKLTVGVLILILLSSIYFTSFKTINILLIPISFFLIFNNRKSISIKRKLDEFISECPYILVFTISILLCIVIQFYRLDYFNREITYLSNWDYGYYITVAEYLFQTGVENVAPWFELFDSSKTGEVGPYHYGDLWLLGSIIWISELAPLKTFLYVFLPICVSISFAGLLTINSIVSNQKNTILNILICFLMVFSIGNIPFMREAYGFHYSAFTTPKIILFFIFIMLAVSFLIENRFHLFVITSSIIPIFHIIYAPIIFSSLFLWSLFYFYKTRNKEYFFGMIFPSLIAVGIFIFYFLFGGVSSFYNGTSKIMLTTYLQEFSETIFRNIIARFLLFYPFLLLLMGLLWKERHNLSQNMKRLFVFTSMMIFLTILIRGLLNYNRESQQIYQVVLNPIFTILYVIIFSYFLNKPHYKRKYLVYSLIFLQGFSSFYIVLNKFQQREKIVGNEFLIEIQTALQKKNPIGVFIKSMDIDDDHFRVSTYMFLFATELKMIGKSKWVNSISVPEDLDNFKFSERISDVSSSPFYNFIQELKQQNNYVNYELAQKGFIEKYNVDYILLEKGAILPNELEMMLSDFYEDEKSGIRLGIFKR